MSVTEEKGKPPLGKPDLCRYVEHMGWRCPRCYGPLDVVQLPDDGSRVELVCHRCNGRCEGCGQ